jgi:hypothetical protein
MWGAIRIEKNRDWQKKRTIKVNKTAIEMETSSISPGVRVR